MTGEKDSSFNFLSSVLSFSLWLICNLSFSCQAVGSTSQYHPSYFTSSAKFFKTHLWTSFRFHSFSIFFRPEKAQVASLRRRSFTPKEIMRCLARSTREFERNGKDIIMCFLITGTSQGHLYLLRIDAVGLESKMLKKKHRSFGNLVVRTSPLAFGLHGFSAQKPREKSWKPGWSHCTLRLTHFISSYKSIEILVPV